MMRSTPSFRSFNKSLAYLTAVAATFVFIVTISLTVQRPWFQTTAKTTGAFMEERKQEPKEEHKVHIPYYNINDQWDSLLTLNNSSMSPLVVSFKVYSLEGNLLTLPDQTLQPLQNTRLRLADLIGQANPSKFREGSIEVSFVHESPTALAPHLIVANENERLVFDMEHMRHGHSLGHAMGQESAKLEGVWWLMGEKTEAKVILSNTMDRALGVQVNLDINAASIPVAPIVLSAHQTVKLDIENLLKEAGHTYRDTAIGGISISYDGAPGSLMAQGSIVDREKNINTSLHLIDPATLKSSYLDGAGFPIGRYAITEQADEGTLFKPTLVLKNITGSKQQATVSVQYTIGNEMKTETLPVATIAPREVRTMDFRPILRSLGRSVVKDAGIRVDMNGQQGALIGELISVSDEGVCFNVPLLSVNPKAARTGAHPIRLDGDFQSILHLKNTGDKPTEALVRIVYDGKFYDPDLIKIRPGESVPLDIRKLVNSGKPDGNGNTLPINLIKGQVLWFQHGDQTLIGRLIHYSPSRKSTANFSCLAACGCGPVFDHADISPSEYEGSPDSEDGTNHTGTIRVFEYNVFPPECGYPPNAPVQVSVTLSSWDSSVADVGFFGSEATLVGPGDTTIQAEWEPIYSWSIEGEGGTGCYPNRGWTFMLMAVRSTRVRLENEAGNNLAGTNKDAIVGEHIRLYLRTIPARSFTDLNWDITGAHKQKWDVHPPSSVTDPVSTASVESTVTNDTPVNFFWHDGDFNGKAETVTMRLKIGGRQYQRRVNYRVFRPLVDVNATKGEIKVDNVYDPSKPPGIYLHYGIPVGAPGNDLHAINITIPLGLTGHWQWVRTVAADRTSGTLHASGFGLDAVYPSSLGLQDEDSPAQQLTSGGVDIANSPMICNDAFDTYLMFMPDLQNAHWVPMKKIHWNWFGTATESFFGTWSLESSGTDTTTVSNWVDFPTWGVNYIPNFR
jgi:hypothetical protein